MEDQIVDTTNLSNTEIVNLMVTNTTFKLAVTGQMERYAGSFVKAIATAIIFADPINLRKISEAFVNYVKEYIPDEYKRSDQA